MSGVDFWPLAISILIQEIPDIVAWP